MAVQTTIFMGTTNTQCKSLKSIAKDQTSDLHNFNPCTTWTFFFLMLGCTIYHYPAQK